jgi:UDP-3-O-[3-hydroxymyristoyl] glucosamine N-acyltransferase
MSIIIFHEECFYKYIANWEFLGYILGINSMQFIVIQADYMLISIDVELTRFTLLLIGNKVVIENAYVWDNVTIEDNCCVSTSVVCDNVVIYESTSVQPGCILSWDVSYQQYPTIWYC